MHKTPHEVIWELQADRDGWMVAHRDRVRERDEARETLATVRALAERWSNRKLFGGYEDDRVAMSFADELFDVLDR